MIKRIMLLLTVGSAMAAMVLALAVPAFAAVNCFGPTEDGEGGYTSSCSGGESFTEPGGASDGGAVGGVGVHGRTDCTADGQCEGTANFGGGGSPSPGGEGVPGGFGQRCYFDTDSINGCVGKGQTGGPT